MDKQRDVQTVTEIGYILAIIFLFQKSMLRRQLNLHALGASSVVNPRNPHISYDPLTICLLLPTRNGYYIGFLTYPNRKLIQCGP